MIKQSYYKGVDKQVNHWFKDLFEGMKIKEDRKEYPDSIFFFKGDECYAEQDENFGEFLYSYGKIHQVLQSKFGLKDQEIWGLIKRMIEQHFKMEVCTPLGRSLKDRRVIEQHLKNK